jgi:hypothetical protein
MVAKLGPVKGGPETAAAFDQLAGDVRDMPAVHGKVAEGRLAGVASRTPVLTGQLRGSWEAAGTARAGSIMSPLAYAATIEGGSVRGVVAVGMVARTLEAEAGKVADEYDAAILELARRRGFAIE